MKLSHPDDWTRYLRNHTLTSFGRIFPDNYDGAIRGFWQQQLTAEPVKHVVDICCGNGALCWIANEILNADVLTTQITGIDFADIDPFQVLNRDRSELPGVRFMGNTNAEALPFDAAAIDLVISQYGIEYSDLGRSIPEAARVLRQGGRMAFFMHDTNSEVVRLSTQHLEDMQTVLSFGIHDLALQLFDLGLQLPTSEARQVSAEYLALIERLNTLTNEVRDIVRSYDKKSPIHRYMNRIMAVFADPADAANPNNRQYLSGAGENLRSFVVKIEHMKAAALTEEAIRGLVGLIDRSGCSVEKLEQLEYSPGLNIGTVLVAVRGEQ